MATITSQYQQKNNIKSMNINDTNIHINQNPLMVTFKKVKGNTVRNIKNVKKIVKEKLKMHPNMKYK